MPASVVFEIDSYTQAGAMVSTGRVDAVVADLNTRSTLTKNAPDVMLEFELIDKLNIPAGLLSQNKERLLKLKNALHLRGTSRQSQV
ncbi:MAG TPA: hypothetical protein VE954_24060 [Oligoflexus sp.]|uniref:hypothetical protein n=1 Tax=Oligoflexus sp. TaxID=1971216 RepID=UPI002D5FC42A|nr:hypothetical protein [Oligoflexus sp.]HYX36189.1 hypothetical protein [Oligoflexus sp.]